jgi:hypothetical protein
MLGLTKTKDEMNRYKAVFRGPRCLKGPFYGKDIRRVSILEPQKMFVGSYLGDSQDVLNVVGNAHE